MILIKKVRSVLKNFFLDTIQIDKFNKFAFRNKRLNGSLQGPTIYKTVKNEHCHSVLGSAFLFQLFYYDLFALGKVYTWFAGVGDKATLQVVDGLCSFA